MAKPRKNAIGAAECARRTGLTVKALRVYERHGLITPARSPQGWRLYGPKKLMRLNTIVVLKGLGLTLAQIRETLTGGSAPLRGVLQIQLDTWYARKAAADKAIALVEAALARLRARKPLSIDELCTLIKSVETDEVQATRAGGYIRVPGLELLNIVKAPEKTGIRVRTDIDRAPVRTARSHLKPPTLLAEVAEQIADEVFTAEEKAQWALYVAKLSGRERVESREHFAASLTLVGHFGKLIEHGRDPASADAQQLLARLNELALKYAYRESCLARFAWNPAIAQKVQTLGTRVLDRVALPSPSLAHNRITDFIYATRAASS